jgi:hypothetical protein
MPLPARLVESALVNKLGFRRENRKHKFYLLEIAGNLVRKTMISHGERQIGDKLLSTMARELGITRRQLEDIVACTLSRDDYLRLISVTP